MKHPHIPWLSIKEAAHALSVSTTTIRRLRETLDPRTRRPFLLSRKPTPRLVLICAASLARYQKETQELEFWESRRKVAFKRWTRCPAGIPHRPGQRLCEKSQAPRKQK